MVLGHHNGSEVSKTWYEEAIDAVRECTFPDYAFGVREIHDGALISAIYFEPDVNNPDPKLTQSQKTREWFVPTGASKSDIVRTVFKLVETSFEHRVREWFKYKGKAIHHPHYDVDQLAELNQGMDGL